MIKTTEILRVVDEDALDIKNYDDFVSKIEEAIYNNNIAVELPLIHTFTEGLYSREIFLPQRSISTTRQHEKQHQFVLLKGKVAVITEDGVDVISAPFHGITKPGTHRVVVALEDSIWTTFHPSELVNGDPKTEAEMMDLVSRLENELTTIRNKKIKS